MHRFPKHHRKTSKVRAPKRAGSALVELSVCLPIIMLLIFGTLEACEVILLKQSLTVAAYESARTALVPEVTGEGVETVCNQILSDRGVSNAVITITPSDLTTMVPGEYVSVNIVAPADGNCVLGMFSGNTQVDAHVEMMAEF